MKYTLLSQKMAILVLTLTFALSFGTNFALGQTTDSLGVVDVMAEPVPVAPEFQELTFSDFSKDIWFQIVSGFKYTFDTIRQATSDIISINPAPTVEPGVVSAIKKASAINSNAEQANGVPGANTSTQNTTTGVQRSSGSSSGSSSGGGSGSSSSSSGSGSGSTNTSNATAPQSTPRATPTNTASPRATPSTQATPNSTPRSTPYSVPSPSVYATPSATPTPTPTPTPSPTPSPTSGGAPQVRMQSTPIEPLANVNFSISAVLNYFANIREKNYPILHKK